MLDTYGYNYAQSEYVILIAFPQQQWLHEQVSLLRYAYITGLVSPTHVHPSRKNQVTMKSTSQSLNVVPQDGKFSCRHFGTWNLKAPPRFLENVRNPGIRGSLMCTTCYPRVM